MGKLHTLRRAILRDPKKWTVATGAIRSRNGQWSPSTYWWENGAYKSFIKNVLTTR